LHNAPVIIARIRPNVLAHKRPQQSSFTPSRFTCDRIVTTYCTTASTVIRLMLHGGTAAAAPPPSGLATLPSVGAIP